jgi:uncharacterized protein (TIGR02611 family)
MGPVGRLRERLVLGELRTHLAPDEQVVSWAHAQVPGVRAPAVLVVTDQRCLVHIASVRSPDTHAPLGSLVRFDLDQDSPDRVRVRLNGAGEELVVELSLATRARSRAVGRVLSSLTRRNIGAPETFDPSKTSPLPPVPRGMKDHARRVWVTVVGVAVLLLSLAFASPFVPGPGALTAVAGIAILAREYEWARDVHVWANRQAERFVAWARDRVVRARTGSHGRVGADDVRQEAGPVGAADVEDAYRGVG